MDSTEFRHLAEPAGADRADRLFRAAISAYCALSRPGREDRVQLDELSAAFYGKVSKDARRFACAALSQSRNVPRGLLMRLADEPVDICAPLLIGSPALAPRDLVALIARHGLTHARVIARRRALDPRIDNLVRALDIAAQRATGMSGEVTSLQSPSAAQDMLGRLRGMMAANSATVALPEEPPVPLGSAQLGSGRERLTLWRMMAERLQIDAGTLRRFADDGGPASLMTVLRALGLETAAAYMVMSAFRRFGSDAHGREGFAASYEAIPVSEARQSIARLAAPPGSRVLDDFASLLRGQA